MAKRQIAQYGVVSMFLLALIYFFLSFDPVVTMALPGMGRGSPVTHTVLFQWKQDAPPEAIREVRAPAPFWMLELLPGATADMGIPVPGVRPHAGSESRSRPSSLQAAVPRLDEGRPRQFARGLEGT